MPRLSNRVRIPATALLEQHAEYRAALASPVAMTSGITVTSNPNPAQLQSLGVTSWPTWWGWEITTFPCTYEEQETSLVLKGDVTVTLDGGQPVPVAAP